MTCDYNVDGRIEEAVDRDYGSTDTNTGIDCPWRRCLGSAFVQEHDNRFDTLFLESGDQSVSGFGFIQETPPFDTRLRDERVSVFEGHADECNPHTSESLN